MYHIIKEHTPLVSSSYYSGLWDSYQVQYFLVPYSIVHVFCGGGTVVRKGIVNSSTWRSWRTGLVTLASVLQVSCFHVLIGGEREHPSTQLPLIFLSGRGFSRVPGSFLTARSLSFSLRFSDGSGHARECRATKLQDAINEGGSPRSLLCLIHHFLLVSSIWLRQFLYFPRLTTCHTSTHFTGKGATCITVFNSL